MRTLWQNGLYAAITGQTTLEEVVRLLAASML
jgi:type II secretory ATPase GspE/PulE/Tfp pilus assembly ATPase PilB-like protein